MNGDMNGMLTLLKGNIVVIGVVLGAVFLYGVYMQRTGQAAPGTNKKVN